MQSGNGTDQIFWLSAIESENALPKLCPTWDKVW